MGYRVKKTDFKKGPGWKLQLINADKITDIPKDMWLSHGFSPSLSMDDARAQATSLNRIAARKRQAVLVQKHQEETVRKNDEVNAHFPSALLEEFEKLILRGRIPLTPKEVKAQKKKESHWLAAKRAIVAVNLDYPDWLEQKFKFYDYFASECISYSYVQKITILLNSWGHFCAKRQTKYFKDLPLPRKRERNRISDRYRKSVSRTKESKPLTPAMLKAAKGKIKDEYWNWFYLSVWFGLRPEEVDILSDPEQAEILYDDKLKKKVLKVNQPKLSGLEHEDRFKYIICNFPEQVKGLEIMKLPRKRPYAYTARAAFGLDSGVNLYGGRKGFEQMLLERGERFENISSQLGHQTVDRTWKDYRNKRKARYLKAA